MSFLTRSAVQPVAALTGVTGRRCPATNLARGAKVFRSVYYNFCAAAQLIRGRPASSRRFMEYSESATNRARCLEHALLVAYQSRYDDSPAVHQIRQSDKERAERANASKEGHQPAKPAKTEIGPCDQFFAVPKKFSSLLMNSEKIQTLLTDSSYALRPFRWPIIRKALRSFVIPINRHVPLHLSRKIGHCRSAGQFEHERPSSLPFGSATAK